MDKVFIIVEAGVSHNGSINLAKRFIKKGEKFTEDNLTCKRLGNGLSPIKWKVVLGKLANKDFKEDKMISL